MQEQRLMHVHGLRLRARCRAIFSTLSDLTRDPGGLHGARISMCTWTWPSFSLACALFSYALLFSVRGWAGPIEASNLPAVFSHRLITFPSIAPRLGDSKDREFRRVSRLGCSMPLCLFVGSCHLSMYEPASERIGGSLRHGRCGHHREVE